MHYEGNIIRPPSEANSILLQITVGCSRNKCTFCGTYTGERFRIKPDSVIMQDIEFAAQYARRQRRIFLCDGDALIIPQKRLLKILQAIEERLPRVTRVGAYGNAKSLDMKTPEELAELKSHGLGIVYMGLETGDDVGIAGRERSQIHAQETGRVLSAIDPDYVGALSLMLIPGTPLFDDYQSAKFELIEPDEMLAELRTMIAATNLSRGLFHANHASNYLPIKARLPKDKETTLNLIDQALEGKIALKPEYLRAL
jgi:radical SAM superfamily enzyme YgiQ (UPF0313 family)